jgi:hypothetical protein
MLGIKAGAVKNFCKLRGIGGYGGGVGKNNVAQNLRKIVIAQTKCAICLKEIAILNGGRARKYCSDACRKKAWNNKRKIKVDKT